MTVDFSEITAFNGLQGSPCSVGVALARMSPEDRAKAEAALAADKGVVQHVALHRWLQSKGLPVRKGSVAEHRAGQCSCKKRGMAR